MSENELLLQTLAHINASLAALDVRLNRLDEADSDRRAAIAVLQERTDKNVMMAAASMVGAVLLGLIKALDWFSGR